MDGRRDRRLLHCEGPQRASADLRLLLKTNPVGGRRPSYLRATKPGGSRRTLPDCRSCCVRSGRTPTRSCREGRSERERLENSGKRVDAVKNRRGFQLRFGMACIAKVGRAPRRLRCDDDWPWRPPRRQASLGQKHWRRPNRILSRLCRLCLAWRSKRPSLTLELEHLGLAGHVAPLRRQVEIDRFDRLVHHDVRRPLRGLGGQGRE